LRADSPDALAEGGRGLHIISALADTIRIVHERSGWVVLRMVKHLVRNPERTEDPPVG
jgi:anti-sigma regulatory factor (Ser/Thr protein kinase)